MTSFMRSTILDSLAFKYRCLVCLDLPQPLILASEISKPLMKPLTVLHSRMCFSYEKKAGLPVRCEDISRQVHDLEPQQHPAPRTDCKLAWLSPPL